MWDQDSESGYGTDELTILPVVVDPLYLQLPWELHDPRVHGSILGLLAIFIIISITLLYVF